MLGPLSVKNRSNREIHKQETLLKNSRKTQNNKKGCPHIIHKDEKLKYVNLNPSSPTIRGLIKIYKAAFPIRLIVYSGKLI